MAQPITPFQAKNGCSACDHAGDADAAGVSAAVHGKGFWCKKLGKFVDSKDGVACPEWLCPT